MIVSEIRHGNMHPNLPVLSGSAQSNFDKFIKMYNLTSDSLIGMRIDPSWQHGSTIASEIPKYSKFGSVECHERVAAHAVISNKNIGLFVLSGDCFPLSISTKKEHALLHLGWRSVDENLIANVVSMLRDNDKYVGSYQVSIGPGLGHKSNIMKISNAAQLQSDNKIFWEEFVEYTDQDEVLIDLRSAITKQLADVGIDLDKSSIDRRNTYTDINLFSRRSYIDGCKSKPRGNHVAILPPE